MGRSERSLSPELQARENNPRTPQNEGFLLHTPEKMPRKLYEFSGDTTETPQIKRYRVNLRKLQDDYMKAGLHTDKAELTQREREILHFLGQGLSFKEIAAEVYIEPATVNRHINNIRSRYHSETALERVLTGTVLGDIDLPSTIEHEVLRRLGYTHFSPREWDVLRTLTESFGRNSTNAAISSRLGIKITTAESHIDHIMTKLNVNRRTVLGTNVFVAFVSTGDYHLEYRELRNQENIVFDASQVIRE